MASTQNFAIIVAAGKGLRMGSGIKKQYLCLDKIPVLARTVHAFDQSGSVAGIFLVVPEEDIDFCREKIIQPFDHACPVHIVRGGERRQDSVYNGLKEIMAQAKEPEKAIVLIHDGVRPFVDKKTIDLCIHAAAEHGACLPAVKVSDTIKKVQGDFRVEKTVDRHSLYCAQTPQAFRLDVISRAFEYAAEKGFEGTDDASLVEYWGRDVVIVEGGKYNIKLTTPEDLVYGEFILTKNV